MHPLQERRERFVESNPGFADTKRPVHLWRKLAEETREALVASFVYFRMPTEPHRTHLEEELADMVQIVMDLSSIAKIDIFKALEKKLQKDELRFPPGTVKSRRDYYSRKVELGERKRRNILFH